MGLIICLYTTFWYLVATGGRFLMSKKRMTRKERTEVGAECDLRRRRTEDMACTMLKLHYVEGIALIIVSSLVIHLPALVGFLFNA